MVKQNTILQTYQDRLPWHGFATDDLTYGVRMYALSQAIQKAIIQHNWKHSLGWLVYDVDRGTAAYDYEDKPIPPPNMIVVNQSNGHGHLFYGLETPVHRNAQSSLKAQRYAGAVDVALTAALQADPGYSKLLSKNPLHDRWITLIPRVDLYDLDELASWLDLTKYQDRRKRLPAIGEGRNVTLFERLRIWAYRARRQPYLSEEMFHEAVRNQALVINAEFMPPLPHSECRRTAKSVAQWTWRNMSPQAFRAYQSLQGKRSGAKRTEAARILRQAIRETREQCPGLTQADIAAIHGVTQKTVSVHLRK